MSNHPYPLNTKLKHKKTLVIFVFLIFCFQKLIGQETKNYFGDYYQNCSWLEGVYLSPNGTAFGKIETYYTSHVVQVTDLENGIKIDSSGKELIGFLFQY